MIRAFVLACMLAAFAVIIYKVNLGVAEIDQQTTVSVTSVSEFIVLRNKKANQALVAARQVCGDMTVAIEKLRGGIGDEDGEEKAISYDEVIGDVVDHLLFDGTIRRGCLYKVRNDQTYGLYGPYEGELWVLLSTRGDIAIGLAGKAITPWPDVMAEGSFRPDILLVDDSPYVINQEVVVAQK